MLIDWFTVGAQALNFLILVWLLKRFLYKPILNAVDAREALVAGKLADAEAKEADANKERDAFKKKNDAFDRAHAKLMDKAAGEAAAERTRLLDEARAAADALSAKRAADVRRDADSLNQALALRAQHEVFAIARQALSDLAGVSLEDRLEAVFIQRLHTMDPEAKASLAGALKAVGEPALLRSAFELSAAQRTALQDALNTTLSTKVRLRLETAPDLINGIELIAHGQKISWSISDYLTSLEQGVEDLLNEKRQPNTKPKAQPKATAPTKKPPQARTREVAKPQAKGE
jgi:F-type H+-transporting ATPase subunit b